MSHCLLCNKKYSIFTLKEQLDCIPVSDKLVVSKKHYCGSASYGVAIGVYKGDVLKQELPHTYKDYPSVHKLDENKFIISVTNENFLYKNNKLFIIYPGFEIHNSFAYENFLVLFGKVEDSKYSKLIAYDQKNFNRPVFEKPFDPSYAVCSESNGLITFVSATPVYLSDKLLSEETYENIIKLYRSGFVSIKKTYLKLNMKEELKDSPFGVKL